MYSLAQKCLQINPKPYHQINMDFFFNRISADWLIDQLMPSGKNNSVMAKAAGLIYSLLNVALSRDASSMMNHANFSLYL